MYRKNPPVLNINYRNVLAYCFLSFGSIVMVAPFAWMVLTSFKAQGEIISYPPVWFPKEISFKRYVYIFEQASFGRFFLNSMFISTTITILQLLTSSMVGYVLSKYEFRGKNVIFLGILSIMMVPGTMFLIPNYTIITWLNLIDTYWALIIPGLFSPFGIFLMRQFTRSVPNELLDAARIDGASEIGIFFRIVVPLCKPAFSALGIFTFMGSWNDLVWPLIVLNSERLFTLPIGLSRFTSHNFTDYGMVLAGATVTVIPIIAVYFVFQKQFIQGIALTGLKA